MPITNDKDLRGGEPCIEGRRIPVWHVIANVQEAGLEEYVEDYDVAKKDAKEAIAYCMQERCVGTVVRYCEYCRKNREQGQELWKVAQGLYEKYCKPK